MARMGDPCVQSVKLLATLCTMCLPKASARISFMQGRQPFFGSATPSPCLILAIYVSFYKAGHPLHTPNRLITEFNMGTYDYALTRRVKKCVFKMCIILMHIAIATHVNFSN